MSLHETRRSPESKSTTTREIPGQAYPIGCHHRQEYRSRRSSDATEMLISTSMLLMMDTILTQHRHERSIGA